MSMHSVTEDMKLILQWKDQLFWYVYDTKIPLICPMNLMLFSGMTIIEFLIKTNGQVVGKMLES